MPYLCMPDGLPRLMVNPSFFGIVPNLLRKDQIELCQNLLPLAGWLFLGITHDNRPNDL